MKIFSVIVFNGFPNLDDPVIVSRNEDMSTFSFIKRGTVKETIVFVSHEVASRTPNGNRISVFRDMEVPVDGVSRIVAHCYNSNKAISYVVVTDGEYPAKTAHSLGHKAIDMLETQYSASVYNRKEGDKQKEVNISGFNEVMSKYQNPKEADPIAKINADLEETREIMVQNIEKLIDRGEQLDDLVERSRHLSVASKVFLKKSKKMNSCNKCNIL